MNTATVLVILTLLADGQLSAAFVNTDDPATCAERAAAIGAVLRQGGADVQTLRCVPSDLRFTRFSHRDAATAPRHAYRLRLDASRLEVTPVADLARCRADAAGDDGRVCVTSTQSLQGADTH